MWIMKPDREYNKQKRIGFLKNVIKTFIISFILTSLAAKYGLGPTRSGITPTISWLEFLDYFPLIIIVSLILSIFIPLSDLYRISNLICNKCFTVKSNDGEKHCECGGKFIDLRKMQWVDKKSEGRKSKK